MRRYDPSYYSPPRRGYSSRGRSPPRGGYSPPRRGYSPQRRGYSPQRRGYSPPRRGYSPPRRGYGGYGRRKDSTSGSLLVRNIPLDCRPEELRVPFERFGPVRDVYLPKDYYTGEPRGFAFVQFVDSHDSSEAQYHMNGQLFAGREISVVFATESRKRPEEMRRMTRKSSGGPRYGGGGQRAPAYRRSHSRSVSRSRSPPRYRSGSGAAHNSRSYSPSPRRQVDRSSSPRGDSPHGRDGRRSYSPENEDRIDPANGKAKYEDDRNRVSRSPSGSRSRSRSEDASPVRSR